MSEENSNVGEVTLSRYEQIVAELRDVVEQQTRGQFTIGDRALEIFTDRRSSDTSSELRRFINYMSVTVDGCRLVSLIRVTVRGPGAAVDRGAGRGPPRLRLDGGAWRSAFLRRPAEECASLWTRCMR